MTKSKEQELFPFEPKSSTTEEEMIINGYVKAMRIVDELDYATLHNVFNECKTMKRDFNKKAYLLKSLPSFIMDVIQFQALEECVTRRLFPNDTPNVSIPFAYNEARAIVDKQIIS